MYNIPLDGLRINALLQYSVFKEKGMDNAIGIVESLSGLSKNSETYESSGCKIPTTLSEFQRATGFNPETIGRFVMEAQLLIASEHLTYKTLFLGLEPIIYILNGNKDPYRSQITMNALNSMIQEYKNNVKDSKIPEPAFSENSKFIMLNWVIYDIFAYFGRQAGVRESKQMKSHFLTELNRRKEAMTSLKTPSLLLEDDPVGPFAKMLYYSCQLDELCCSVDNKVLLRFIDIMALREELAARCQEGVDYSAVNTTVYEKGDENLKLIQYEKHRTRVIDVDKEIVRSGDLYFTFNTATTTTATEQDKNIKKMFYKLMVEDILNGDHSSLFDLITSVNVNYSELVYTFKQSIGGRPNSVTYLMNPSMAPAVNMGQLDGLFQTILDEQSMSDWYEEYYKSINAIQEELGNTWFYMMPTSGESILKMPSNAALSKLFCIANLVMTLKELLPVMYENGLSWRTFRKLYKEYDNRGELLSLADTTVMDLYHTLQFKKRSSDGFEVEFIPDPIKLIPVFPLDKVETLVELINSIENPLSLQDKLQASCDIADNEYLFDTMSTLIKVRNNRSLPRMLSDLKESVTFLRSCIRMYELTEVISDKEEHKYSIMFPLMFDKKVAEVNAQLGQLTESINLPYLETNQLNSYIKVLFGYLFRSRSYHMPYCLGESDKYDYESYTIEEHLNEILEEVLKENNQYIENLAITSTLKDIVHKEGYTHDVDFHYRSIATHQLIIEPMGNNRWGVLNSVTGYTIVIQGDDGTWEIERNY